MARALSGRLHEMPPARKKRAAHGEDSAPPSRKQARTTDAASRVDGTEENSARAVRSRRGAAGAVVQGQVSQLHLSPPVMGVRGGECEHSCDGRIRVGNGR